MRTQGAPNTDKTELGGIQVQLYFTIENRFARPHTGVESTTTLQSTIERDDCNAAPPTQQRSSGWAANGVHVVLR